MYPAVGLCLPEAVRADQRESDWPTDWTTAVGRGTAFCFARRRPLLVRTPDVLTDSRYNER
jgi:hypothetical protein